MSVPFSLLYFFFDPHEHLLKIHIDLSEDKMKSFQVSFFFSSDDQ